jgi:hypothetical protein
MTLRIDLARSPQDELLSVGKPVSRRLRLTELLCRLVACSHAETVSAAAHRLPGVGLKA